MTKASPLFLAVVLFCTAGMYGCTQQKNGAASAKVRDMEARYTKLEEDYRVILSANEANRRKLVQLETQRSELTQKIQELQVVVKERDDLQKELVTRTEERDNVQTQLFQFSKDLQSLAGRAHAAATRSFGGALSALPASRKSQ